MAEFLPVKGIGGNAETLRDALESVAVIPGKPPEMSTVANHPTLTMAAYLKFKLSIGLHLAS